MPQVGDIWEGYKSTEYILTVDAIDSPSVTSISGLSAGTYETIEQPDGGSTHVHKISSTKVTFEPLVVEMRVDGGPGEQLFQDWWQETFNLADNVSMGSRVRKNFQITKLDNGVPVLIFLIRDGWIKSSKYNTLEAGSDGFFTHTVEIEHEGLERVPA